jgi:hypothetical protein
MNKVRMLALGCGVTLAAVLAAPAPAQPGAPPAQPQKEPPAAQAKTPTPGVAMASLGGKQVSHGDLVTFTQDGKQVQGRFVFMDPASNTMYVRTEPGKPPMKVPTQGLDDLKVVPAAGGPDKGGIQFAIEGDGKQPTPGNEIFTMEVNNGPFTTRFFYDNSLSPAERDELSAIEKASRDVAQKAMLVQSLRKSLEDAANNPDSGTTVVQTGGAGYTPPAYPYYWYSSYNYPYLYPVGYYNLYYYLYYPMYPGLPYGPGSYGGGGGNSTVVVQNSGSGTSNVASLTKSLNEAQAALAQAQQNLAAANNRAVYDPSGRIVAVRLEQ